MKIISKILLIPITISIGYFGFFLFGIIWEYELLRLEQQTYYTIFVVSTLIIIFGGGYVASDKDTNQQNSITSRNKSNGVSK